MSENVDVDAGTEALKSLIISTAQELWEDKEALGKFFTVVRRSSGFAAMADALEQSTVRPAKASFYKVKSTEFQAS
ncbi:hypothetical protein [Streptacidiphilus anmyonensis]|uniref:hypothetical protein n=1 Tax=Streptacidiphilus anmyonensis TaxID=405782 RepID=UPI0005A7C047|nr:hypothetical protein [Streptacidiphilus anmyonensis]